jgi:hypothetical protein
MPLYSIGSPASCGPECGPSRFSESLVTQEVLILLAPRAGFEPATNPLTPSQTKEHLSTHRFIDPDESLTLLALLISLAILWQHLATLKRTVSVAKRCQRDGR